MDDRGLHLTKKSQMKRTDIEQKIELRALSIRQQLNPSNDTPFDIIKAVLLIPGLSLSFAPLSENISGICYKDLNLLIVNYKQSYGRTRFTIAHELYHYFVEDSKNNTVISSLLLEKRNKEEKYADIFASYLLAPREEFLLFLESLITPKGICIEDIVKIEQHFQMSRHSTLIRLQIEGCLDQPSFEQYSQGAMSQARLYGYSDKLYKPLYDKPTTLGHYVVMANELFKNDLITKSKRNELLLDGFRDDIVFGENGEIND